MAIHQWPPDFTRELGKAISEKVRNASTPPAAPSADPAPEEARDGGWHLLNNPKMHPCRVCGGVHQYGTRQCVPAPVQKDDLTSAQQYIPGSGKVPIADSEAEYLGEQLHGVGEQPYTRGEQRQWRFDQDVNAKS